MKLKTHHPFLFFFIFFVCLFSGPRFLLCVDINISPKYPTPGSFVFVVIKVDSKQKKGKVYENSKERTFYYLKKKDDFLYYFFVTGFDVEYFPKELKVKAVFWDDQNNQTKQVLIVPLKTNEEKTIGRVSLPTSEKKQILNEKTKSQLENEFFHQFFLNETKAKLWQGHWVPPLESLFVVSEYGKMRLYDNGQKRYHRGIDFRAIEGTSVFAPNSGKVVWAGKKYVRGNVVVIDHGCGLHTTYFHLSEIRVKEGEYVRRGEKIGEVGDTGLASGPHLHWGVRCGMNAVDGLVLLKVLGNSASFKEN